MNVCLSVGHAATRVHVSRLVVGLLAGYAAPRSALMRVERCGTLSCFILSVVNFAPSIYTFSGNFGTQLGNGLL